MGSTAVLRVTAVETQASHVDPCGACISGCVVKISLSQAMALEEKRQWCAEHGKRLHDEDGIRNRLFSFQQVRANLRICAEAWHKRCQKQIKIHSEIIQNPVSASAVSLS